MSVYISYNGRFGNCIFQYTCARLFAEQNNLNLATRFKYDHILATSTPKPGRFFTAPVYTINDTGDVFETGKPEGLYVFNGYFQIAKWYYDRREHIKSFFNLSNEPVNSEDIVAHIRLGDFRTAWGSNRAIDSSWYLKCLEMEKFRRLYILTENYDTYLEKFKSLNPIVFINRNWFNDWNFLRGFERAILSNGSYAWTATFLGNAKKTYVFTRGCNDKRQDLSGGYAIPVDGKFEIEC